MRRPGAVFWLLTLGASWGFLAAAFGQQPPSSPPSTPKTTRSITPNDYGSAPFNTLVAIVVDADGRGMRLYGRWDPNGPRIPIDYEEVIAEAMQLPLETGAFGAATAIPGFNLEPSPEFLQAYVQVNRRFPNGEALGKAIRDRLYRNTDTYSDFLATLIEQYPQAFATTIREFISERSGSAEGARLLPRYSSPAEIGETLSLVSERFGNSPQAMQDFQARLQATVDEVVTTRGHVTFYPPGVFEDVLGKRFTSVPEFQGINPRGTLGHIVFDADIALKTLAGRDSLTVRSRLVYHRSMIEHEIRNASSLDQLLNWPNDVHTIGRISVVPASIRVNISDDGKVAQIEEAKMQVRVGAWDPRESLDSNVTSYADFLTEHLDEYARVLPAFWNLREAIKAVATVRVMRARGVQFQSRQIANVWNPPTEVDAQWCSIVVGLGSRSIADGYNIFGGVSMQVGQRTSTGRLPQEPSARARTAAEQLANVVASDGSCFDGRGCQKGEALNTIRVEGRPRGSAALSPAAAAAMQKDERGSQLLARERELQGRMQEASKRVESFRSRREQQGSLSGADAVEYTRASDEQGRIQQQIFAVQVETETRAKDLVRVMGDAIVVIEE